MDSKILYFAFVFFLGLIIYFIKPRYLFIYWMGVAPLVTPFFFFLFPVDNETFFSLYFTTYRPLSYMLCVILILEYIKHPHMILKDKMVIYSSLLLLAFLIIQNVNIAFSISSCLSDIFDVSFMVCPLLLLARFQAIRPTPKIMVVFVKFIVILQAVCCFLNVFGIRIYKSIYIYDSFELNAISGSFARYNHMANYLTTLFLFISVWYFVTKTISKKTYIELTTIIGALVLLSGAKVSLVLYLFVFFSFLYLHNRSKVKRIIMILAPCIISLLLFFHIKGINQGEAEKVSGLERNIYGLAHVLQSSSKDDDSTLFLSTLLYDRFFDNPILGNGYLNYDIDKYSTSIGNWYSVDVFLSDARLLFTLVEYGILGTLLYIFFYFSVFRYVKESTHLKGVVVWLIAGYYILLTVTEIGIFDIYMYAMIFIFLFAYNPKKILILK